MAATAAAFIVAVLQVGTRHQLQEARAGNRAVAAVLAAPDARIQASRTSVGGTVTAVISARHREAVITATGMPTPAGSKVYQLWVISASDAHSAGLLPSSTAGGATSPVLAAGVQAGDKLGITIEPTGGTTSPTTTPVVLIPASA